MTEKQTNEIIRCNKCAKLIAVENGIPREDFIRVKKDWGYFSKKDGITWKLVLCEECSERLVREFAVPVQVEDTVEFL